MGGAWRGACLHAECPGLPLRANEGPGGGREGCCRARLTCSSPSPHQEEHKQLDSLLGFEVTAMLCVPVTSRATSQVVALACAFNKLGGER